MTVGDVPCWALRVTYVGELGWELYASAEFGLALWDTLIEAGRPHGLVPGGYRAIDALRLEKGYRVWGTDITSETDPYSSGLGFAVRSTEQFLGRERYLSVLFEGGSKVNWAALESGAVDKIFFYYAPKILGGAQSLPVAGGTGRLRRSDALLFRDTKLHPIPPDEFAVEAWMVKP